MFEQKGSFFLFQWRGGTFFAILAIASPSSFSVPFHLAPFSAKSGARTNGGRRRYDDGKERWGGKLVAGKCSTWVRGASFGTLGSHVSVPKINSSKIVCFQKKKNAVGLWYPSVSDTVFFVRTKGQGQKITSWRKKKDSFRLSPPTFWAAIKSEEGETREREKSVLLPLHQKRASKKSFRRLSLQLGGGKRGLHPECFSFS